MNLHFVYGLFLGMGVFVIYYTVGGFAMLAYLFVFLTLNILFLEKRIDKYIMLEELKKNG